MGSAYAQVHLRWTIPPALVLWYAFRRVRTHRDVVKTCVLIVIAVVSTIPWDSYLIRNKIWSYPSTSVIGPTLFQIPLEEVFFFVIQTYITSCIYAVVSRPVIHAVLLPRSGREGRRAKWIGTSAFLTITAASVVQLQKGGEGTYLALILVWASPFLALLWAVASTHIIALPLYASLLPIVAPTLYLWLLDSVALRRGTWVIENGTKLGYAVYGLEIEEAIFFIATNVLIVFGLIASDFSLAIHDAYPSLYPLKTSSSFPSLPQVLKSVTTSPNSYPQQHLTDLQDAIHTLAKASPSFHAASVTFEGKLRLDLLSLYSWCRVCDDLVDEAPTPDAATASVNLIKTFLDLIYVDPLLPCIPNVSVRSQVDKLLFELPPASQSAFRLLATLSIPRSPLDELLAGFTTDLLFSNTPPSFPIRTDADLVLYANNVASSVAELCVSLVWANEGYHLATTPQLRASVLSSAREMGVALQLVNIARDVAVDIANGRMYLPGVPLKVDIATTTKARRELVLRAREISNRTEPSIRLLPRSAAGGMRAACSVYLAIGSAVEGALDRGDLTVRARVPAKQRAMAAWDALGRD